MIKKIFVFIITFSILALPSFSLVLAKEVEMSGLVPVCNTTIAANGEFSDPCNFEYLMTMLNYIIDWSFKYLATPIFAILFIYAGYLYITSSGNPGNVNTAKKIIKNALWGYLIILASWLIIDTIVAGLGFTGETYLTEYN
jgi:hypothetical protein